MENNNNVIEINVKELLRALLRKLWLIILIAILCAVGAGLYSKNYLEPYYVSSAKLYILDQQADEHTTMSDLQVGYNLAQDFMILITSRPVMEKVIDKLKLDMHYQQLAGMVSVYTHDETRILELSVAHNDPDMAKLLVDTVAAVSTESMVSIMGIDEVNVVEEGSYPYYPAGPNVDRNIRLAGVAGAIVTAFIIALVHLLNDTIKTSEDIEKHLGLIPLGAIPVEDNGKFSKRKNKKANKQKNKVKDKAKQPGKDAA